MRDSVPIRTFCGARLRLLPRPLFYGRGGRRAQPPVGEGSGPHHNCPTAHSLPCIIQSAAKNPGCSSLQPKEKGRLDEPPLNPHYQRRSRLPARHRRHLAQTRHQVLRLTVMPYTELHALPGSILREQLVERLAVRNRLAVELADHVARLDSRFVRRRTKRESSRAT